MPETDTETGPLRTLIVDDEPLAVERVQVICAEIPAVRVVGTASDGAAALRLAEKLEPDLVLLDMTMPEVDGLSVARELAKQQRPAAIVFVTAHDNYAVEAFDLDAVDYVLKPVAAERLERAIARALAKRGEVQLSRTVSGATPDELLNRALSVWSGYHSRVAARDLGVEITAEDPTLLLYYQNRLVSFAEAIAPSELLEAAREIGQIGVKGGLR